MYGVWLLCHTNTAQIEKTASCGCDCMARNATETLCCNRVIAEIGYLPVRSGNCPLPTFSIYCAAIRRCRCTMSCCEPYNRRRRTGISRVPLDKYRQCCGCERGVVLHAFENQNSEKPPSFPDGSVVIVVLHDSYGVFAPLPALFGSGVTVGGRKRCRYACKRHLSRQKCGLHLPCRCTGSA
jgi:hypothetical protein